MADLHDTVVAFLEADEWPVEELASGQIVATGFAGDSGEWRCYALLQPELERVMFYSLCPVSAPEERRIPVMEFITRANYGLSIGNFEMDLDDGEIRYKTSIDVEGDSLSQALFQGLVYANVVTMDRYLPGLERVIRDDEDPREAISALEGVD